MKSYHQYINELDTFPHLMKKLSQLPSPKTQFLGMLVGLLNVSPNYLRMVLCPTPSGKTLSIQKQEAISIALNISRNILFPPVSSAPGSLIDMYINMPSKSTEYIDLISDIHLVTGASHSSIQKWAKGTHQPNIGRKNAIAKLLGINSISLFPEDSKFSNRNITRKDQ